MVGMEGVRRGGGGYLDSLVGVDVSRGGEKHYYGVFCCLCSSLQELRVSSCVVSTPDTGPVS